jgi:polysaccharide biosynthesis/export protein
MPTLTAVLRRLVLLPVVLLVGCASGPAHPPAPPALPSSLDYTYIIGAGDSVNIVVWRNPELSMSCRCGPTAR